MLGTVCSTGGKPELRRRMLDASLLAVGSTAGGALVGLAAAQLNGLILAAISQEHLGILLAAVAFIAAIRETRMVPLPVLSTSRQVDSIWWGKYDSRLVAVGWGLQFGSGFLTVINSAGLYVLFLFAIWAGDSWTGPVIMGVYGLSRGLEALIALGLEPLGDTHETFIARLDTLRPYVNWACAVALCSVGLLVIH